jgi:hypothetical protein
VGPSDTQHHRISSVEGAEVCHEVIQFIPSIAFGVALSRPLLKSCTEELLESCQLRR